MLERTPLCPQYTKLSDVFDAIADEKLNSGEVSRLRRLYVVNGRVQEQANPRQKGVMTIGTYVSLRKGCDGPDGLRVSLSGAITQDCAERIAGSFISVDWDTIHFQIIVFSDCIMVHASHGQIIGQRLLCKLPISELPKIAFE